jgi:transposase
MVSKRRTYTREFKVETVNLITGSDQSVAEVARDLEIHPNTLYKWIRQYRENPGVAFPGKGKQSSKAEELSRLRRENQRLKMERDILKKAMAIFSNDPK